MADLAQQLVAHDVWTMEGFGWQLGMVCVPDQEHGTHSVNVFIEGDIACEWTADARAGRDLPDIENDATKGGLLGQCRRMAAVVYGTQPGESPFGIGVAAAGELHVRQYSPFGSGRVRWSCRCFSEEFDDLKSVGDTEGEAIARCWLFLADLYLAKKATL